MKQRNRRALGLSRQVNSFRSRMTLISSEFCWRIWRRQDAIWRPARYWQNYQRAILDAIHANGMSRLRSIPQIMRGFDRTTAITPDLSQAAWKRMVWRLLETLPVFTAIVQGYQQAAEAEFSMQQRYLKGLALMVLDHVSGAIPDFRVPAGQTNGFRSTLSIGGANMSAPGGWITFSASPIFIVPFLQARCLVLSRADRGSGGPRSATLR